MKIFTSSSLPIVLAFLCMMPAVFGDERKTFGGASLGTGVLLYSKEDAGLSDADFNGPTVNINFGGFIYFKSTERSYLGADLTAIADVEFIDSTDTGDLLYSFSYWHYLTDDLEKAAPFVRLGIGPSARSTKRNNELIMRRVWGYGAFAAIGTTLVGPRAFAPFVEAIYVFSSVRGVAFQEVGAAIGLMF